MAAGAFAVRAMLLRTDLVATLDGPSAWLSAGSAALFGWLALFGSIGLFLRLDRPSLAMRYLSASSYWVYLTHFPIVGLAQVGLYPLPWPPAAKFALSLGATLGFGLLSYQGLVRRTAIGRWLNGTKLDARRRRPGRAAPQDVGPACAVLIAGPGSLATRGADPVISRVANV